MLMYHNVSLSISVPPKDPNMSHVQKLCISTTAINNCPKDISSGWGNEAGSSATTRLLGNDSEHVIS